MAPHDIETARLRKLGARKVLEDYETPKGFASSRENTRRCISIPPFTSTVSPIKRTDLSAVRPSHFRFSVRLFLGAMTRFLEHLRSETTCRQVLARKKSGCYYRELLVRPG
jgi:hypothetical protein